MNHSDKLRSIIDTAHHILLKIDIAQFNHKSSPEKWSKLEILGHLIDSAYNNHQRFIRAEEQDNLIFRGYNQVNWVKKNNYQNRNPKEIIETWKIANEHLAILIENIPADILNQKTTEHNFHKICMNLLQEGAETSLSYLIWDYIFHLEHHLGQIIDGYECEETSYDISFYF